MRLTILGFGYSASRFAKRHEALFSAIAATCRTKEKARAILEAGYQPLLLDSEGDAGLIASIRASDVILVSAGPTSDGDPFIARCEQALSGMAFTGTRPRRILYLSTIGVYGNHEGGWVSEETQPRATSSRSLWRIKAENAWIELGLRPGIRADILRLAGIYGPGRSTVDALRAGSAKRLIKPGQVFNRIHVTDIADTLRAVLDHTGSRRIWNVTDNEPAPPQDVVSFAANLLGLEPPPEMAFDRATLSPMARSFYSENKRVSNRAIREELGVSLDYPTYREGMQALVQTALASTPASAPTPAAVRSE